MHKIEIIETYWNVNFRHVCNNNNSKSEIIETYWNVNIASPQSFRVWNLEIIETYWNVNPFTNLLSNCSYMK